jgi:hypothetical protein
MIAYPDCAISFVKTISLALLASLLMKVKQDEACPLQVEVLAQFGRRSCQLCAQAAVYPKGNSVLLVPLRSLSEPRDY